MTVTTKLFADHAQTWWKCDYRGCDKEAFTGSDDIRGWDYNPDHNHYCPEHARRIAEDRGIRPKTSVVVWTRIAVVEIDNMRVIIEQLQEQK